MIQSLSRRVFLAKLGSLAAASAVLPLAACGGSAAPAAAPSSPAPAASAAAPPSKPASAASSSAASPAPGASKPAAGSTSVSPAASPASARSSTAAGPKDTVKLGVLKSASDAGFYIGLEKGWYAEQGIDIQTTQFTSAANMVAPLSAGQLDAGGGATSAGLNNAIGREIGIKIVADKGSVPTTSSYQAIVVRKDLASKVKDYKDLKGLKIALPGEAISPQVAVSRALAKGNLTVKDVSFPVLGFPDMAAALSGGSIDAAHPIEPFTTQIPAKGIGVIFKRSYEYSPNDQIAVVLYAPTFIKDRPEVAKRFMVAYLRGARLYNDAFIKKDQAAYNEVIGILAKNTTVKDKTLYSQMQMPGIDPDGKMIVKSMKDDQDWYMAHGYQKTAVDIDAGVDSSYADYAAQQLGGPYKR